jgi:hypothetical protein
MFRWVLVGCCALGFSVGAVLADTLILKDGRELKGNAQLEKDTWTIVTTDGQTLTFPKAEVKRHIFESRVSSVEAARLFREFKGLVDRCLDAPTPEQFVFFRNITERAGSFRYAEESGRVSFGGISHGGRRAAGDSTSRTESTTLRDKNIDAVFVEDWAEYAANFERLAQDLRYKELTRRGKYTGSLHEFATFPPEGLESRAEAVRKALQAVETCIDMAQSTNRLISSLPFQQNQLQDEITRAQNEVEDARALVGDAKEDNRDTRKKKLRDRQSKLRDKVAEMNREIPERSRTAERKINEFTSHREVTRGAFAHVSKCLGEAISNYEPPSMPSEPETQASMPDAVAQATTLILRHRERAAGLTSLGLDQLRIDTEASLRALFEDKTFHMALYVEETDHAEEGGFALLAVDRPNGENGSQVRARLRFGDDLKSKLVMCPKGAHVAVVARIQNVRMEPWSELEKASADPKFVVSGMVRSVESDCG